MNKAIISGNLTRDPELKNTPNGATVANFSIATNEKWKDQSGQMQEKVEFHNIVAWKKTAEICGQYLKKGSKVLLEGKIETRSWENQEGKKIYRTEIIANNVEFLGKLPEQSENASQGSNITSEPMLGEREEVDIPF